MKAKLSLVAVACSILLAACGGGSGSSAPSNGGTSPGATTPPVVTPPPAPTSDLQTTVATPTYAASSQQLEFFNTLNDFRSKLGLGLLAQSAKLDAANANHLKYLLTNTDVDFSAVDPKTGRPFFHLEDPVRVNYTGITELDRANFTQYGGVYVGETGAYGKGQGAKVALTDLIATVYHRVGLMMQSPRDIGIAVGNDQFQTMVVTFGYTTTQQKNASDYFGAYPADKQTNVPRVAYIETPNPFPEITYAEFNTKTSFPITVVTEANSTLAVSAFTVTEAGQSTPLDVRLMTKETDPNKMTQANTASIIGKAPFKPNTSYTVRFVGANNGVTLTKTWTFTTGA